VSFYEKLGLQSHVALIILSLSTMMLCGFLLSRITKKLKLPNVTAYIITGILLGPFVFNLIPQVVISKSDFLSDLALAFIAFSTGEYFKFSVLKKNGIKIVIIVLFEALMATVLVFVACHLILGVSAPLSLVLAALASATAPASTMMTIRQTKAKGDLVDTLLQTVALDDVVSLLAYSLAITIAVAAFNGLSVDVVSIVKPLFINLSVIALGCLFGLIMKFAVQSSSSTDNRLIIAISMLLAFCGLCAIMDASPLLGCMSMAMIYINTTEDDKLFKQINYFSPPFLLLFFVRSGLSFNLNTLIHPTGAIGQTPLVIVGITYFLTRIIGKYTGAYLGCQLAGKPAKVKNYLGLALIPQAGVAIGLATLGNRAIGGQLGEALETIILSSSILYELIGPACGKLALYLSGSYQNKLEDIVQVDEKTPEGQTKSQLDLLIERIQIIQEEIKQEKESEEEKAFTEAAEKYEEIATKEDKPNE